MRNENVSAGEIILRRENYGGTIFHPHDATFVQIDHDAFDVVERVFARHGQPSSDAERELVREVTQALPSTDLRFRVVRNDGVGPTSLNVLTAPILVDFQITERCGLGCPQCYASSVIEGQDASWDDMVLAVEQMRAAGVCQVALGGGEPVLHPRLADFLRLVRDSGMVPNMTTTGIGMTAEQARSIKENCGAIAMSLEGVGAKFALRRKQGFEAFKKQVLKFIELEIPLVLQVTVSRGNFEHLDEIVEYCASVSPLYGVVFLAHKPAGRAEVFDQTLAAGEHPRVHEAMLRAVRRLHEHTRVGFDCCFSPAMTGFESELGFSRGTIVEGCSATRSGIGLTPDLDVLPCTFLVKRRLGNLREKSLLEIWRDSYAADFRDGMLRHKSADSRCRGCPSNSQCLGGCSAWSLTGCQTKEFAANQAESPANF